MRRLGAFGYTRRRAMLALGAIGGSTVIFGTPAHAAYPERPIKIVAPFPPGASNDLTALNFSTRGGGSISHLGAELLKRRANLRLTHVPYAGAAPALQAVLAGTVQLVGITIATALPHIKAGNLVADRCGALARPAGC